MSLPIRTSFSNLEYISWLQQRPTVLSENVMLSNLVENLYACLLCQLGHEYTTIFDFLACDDFGRMFDYSFPRLRFFL